MVGKTNYFSHDSNARNDSKVVKLRMRHGAAGYGVYFMILERLREERDYICECDYEMIAFDFRVEATLVQSVVEDFGLFALTEDGRHFYSESFNKRMRLKDDVSRKRSEAGRKGGLKSRPLGSKHEAKKENKDEPQKKEEQRERPKPAKPQKHKYAPDVLLMEDEYNKLVEAYGKDGADWMVHKLDDYKAARGITYKSDYRAILNWVVKEYQKQQANERDTTYRQSDSNASKQLRDAEFVSYIARKLGSDKMP